MQDQAQTKCRKSPDQSIPKPAAPCPEGARNAGRSPLYGLPYKSLYARHRQQHLRTKCHTMARGELVLEVGARGVARDLLGLEGPACCEQPCKYIMAGWLKKKPTFCTFLRDGEAIKATVRYARRTASARLARGRVELPQIRTTHSFRPPGSRPGRASASMPDAPRPPAWLEAGSSFRGSLRPWPMDARPYPNPPPSSARAASSHAREGGHRCCQGDAPTQRCPRGRPS